MRKTQFVALVLSLFAVLILLLGAQPDSVSAFVPLGITLTPTTQPSDTAVPPPATEVPPPVDPTATPIIQPPPPLDATATGFPAPTREPSSREDRATQQADILPVTGEQPPQAGEYGLLFAALIGVLALSFGAGAWLRKWLRS